MNNQRVKFFVDKNSFWAHGAGVLLALATVLQFIACWGLWNERLYALTNVLLPVESFFIFVLILSFLGGKALWVTILPFLGGIVFYGLQFWFAEDRLVMVIGIAYCVLAIVLFVGTVFTLIRTKWLLVLLFAAPFAYRAFYRDVLILQNVDQPATFAAGMREISLLCVLLAMTFFALGMKKRGRERRGKETQAAPAPVSTPLPEPPSVHSPFVTSSDLSDPQPSQPVDEADSPTETDGV